MPKNEVNEFGEVFRCLRDVLAKHAGPLQVTADTPTKYCLECGIGPATLQSWGGKVRRSSIPVAWVESGKGYVSYHLMGVALPSVRDGMSSALRARMQGKTCFNFTDTAPALLQDLDALTGESIAVFRKSGFIA
jgi:hypothetical protein